MASSLIPTFRLKIFERLSFHGSGSCWLSPCIATVGEDALDEGEPPPGLLQHALRPVAVLDVGTVNLDREQPAIGVGQSVPLAPVDALSSVTAFASPF